MERYLPEVSFLKKGTSIKEKFYQQRVLLAGCLKTMLAGIVLLLSGYSIKAQVNSYNFSQATGTYSALSAATSIFTSSDNVVSAAITIPFTFTYSGTGYTACKVSSNGFLTLGSATPGTGMYTPISTNNANLAVTISGFGADLQTAAKYQTLGVSPNRVFVVEWTGYRYFITESVPFQIKLYETSNVVEIQYGSITTSNTSITTTPLEVGLKSSTNVYNNVTFTNPNLTGYSYTNNWNSLVSGALQADFVGVTSTVFPASGSVLRWVPSSCTQVTTAATATSVSSTSETVSWTNSGTYTAGYKVRWRKVDDEYTVSTWATPVSVAAGSSSYTITGLTPSSYYVYSIEGQCSSSSANNVSLVTTTNTTNGKGLFQTPCGNAALPYSQGFNTATIPACWTQQFVVPATGGSAVQYVASNTNPATTPEEGADYVYWNSYSIATGNQTRLVSPPITTTGSATVNTKFYWFHDNSAYTTAGYADEGVKLQYSLNGTTWIDVQTVNRVLTGTNGWTMYDIVLPAGAGNVPTLYVGFLFTSRAGNNCSLDDVLIYSPVACTTPTAQPTVFNLSSVTSTALSGLFTDASPVPSGYIVLRSTVNAAPVLTNGGTYLVGSTYSISGVSYTVVSKGVATNFSETALTANTQYYYYAISYNGSCIGAPYFLNTAPLTANVLTCTAQPATLTGVAASPTSATITFTTVPGATSYILRYRVNGETTFNIASPAPTVSPYTLTGLAPGTTYDIRLQGPNSNCGTNKTTNAAFTTPCTAITTLPWTEKFDALSVIGAGLMPPCWLNVTGTKAFTSSDASTSSYNDPSSNPYYVTMTYSNTTASHLWTPGFQLTMGVSYDFSFKWAGDGYAGWTGDVLYNNAQSATGATSLGASFLVAGTTTVAGVYNTKTYTFVAPSTGIYYFATKVSSTITPYYLGLDDYSLKVTPPCNAGGTVTAALTSICGTSGGTTITATDYSVTGTGLAYQWQSSTDDFVTVVTDMPSGTNPALVNTGTISGLMYYRLRVYCTSLGYAYSNKVTVNVTNPLVTGTTAGGRCGIGTVSLQATSSAGTTLNWYAAASGGASLGTGSPFTTPSISSTTTFYVDAAVAGSSSAYVGPVSPTAQGGTKDNQTINWRVYFDVTQATTLQSVDVFPVASGQSATLYVYTSGGTLLKSVPYVTTVSGGNTAQSIPINLAMSIGTGYNIYASGIPSSGLKRNISGAVYPYTSSSINITGNGYDATYFMCYYNWKFSTGCEGARTAVVATVTAPPALTTDATSASICSGSSTVVNVTTPASNFTTYSWLPTATATASGTPSGMAVTFNPTTTTTYTLTATNAASCVNKATVLVTVNPAPPTTTNVAICSGSSATLTATSTCINFVNSGTAIPGAWNSTTNPIAIQPIIFLPNSTTCEFDPDGNTQNYTTTTFQVSVSGVYTFIMDDNTIDAMGYIVTGPFVPGTCPGSGTWVVGDDDSGPTSLEPRMDANLTAGTTYTLITTVYSSSSGTTNGAYNWTITPPAGGQLTTVTEGELRWYTEPTAGTLIGTGTPFNPVGVAGSGIASSTSLGSHTYYATCSNNSTCRTAATYTIAATGQWLGGTSTDWSNNANWCGGKPTSTTDGTIMPGTLYDPILGTGTGVVKNLNVISGSILTVSNATMQIYGTITAAAGTINASAGTIELAGSTAQAISGSSFTGKIIKNLVASNNVNVSSTAGDSLKITGALSFGGSSKTFNSGDNVVMVSDINGTGRVADITNAGANSGNVLSGKFIVERYIPARRGWRLMTAPVVAATLTINQAWQENTGGNWALDPRPGYGTHVTGGTARTTAQGYDQGPLNASIYGYSGTAWNYLPPTTSELVNSRQGYMLFIRGSRAINLPLSTPSTTADITTLHPAGTLKYGSQPAITAPTGGWTVIGNPYASPINFNLVSKSGVIGGTGGNAYYLWDPYLGGGFGVGAFVTFSWNGSTYDKSVAVGSGSSSITNTGVIPSSAAFMVNFNAGGSVTVEENDKTTDVLPLTNVFRPAGLMGKLRTALYGFEADSSRFIIDGNLSTFSDNAFTKLDNEDAIKPNNFGEDFAIRRENKNIAIERRTWVNTEDTMFFNMNHMKQKGYELEITAESLQLPNGTIMYLEDTYLHQKTVLSSSGISRVPFTITADAASNAADRFRILFLQLGNGPLPVTFRTIKAWQQAKDIAVEWKVENEINIASYEVEKSLDAQNFAWASNATARGGNRTYNWLDVHAAEGDNFYRVKSRSNNGEIKYSEVVKVNIGRGKPSLSIYPNPLAADGLVNLSFTNMPGGNYTVKIFNNLGQVLLVHQINHAAGSSSEPLLLKNLAKGTYQMEIVAPDKNKTVLSFLY